MTEYRKLQQEGKVRYVVISSSNADGVRALKGHGDLVAIMVGHDMMSPIKRETLQLAEEENLGVVILGALASGFLSGRWFGKVSDIDPLDKRYDSFTSSAAVAALRKLKELEFLTAGGGRAMAQAAVRFVLDTPGVTSVLNGALRPGEIEQTVGALDVPPLTGDERSRALAIAAEANKLWVSGSAEVVSGGTFARATGGGN